MNPFAQMPKSELKKITDFRSIAKWGFGMAPISANMQARYDDAIQAFLNLIDANLKREEIDLDHISQLKGMFNRCVRKDQWDWFSVYTELGNPPKLRARTIALISEFL
jgi:hypothetical protein